MVIIRQHGPNGELFDFNAFVAEVEELQFIDEWQFRIEECLGNGAEEIERLSYLKAARMGADEFKSKYKEIYQTIDGEFVGFKKGRESCRLLAVDSSYWEVSGSNKLEADMVGRYGHYQQNG